VSGRALRNELRRRSMDGFWQKQLAGGGSGSYPSTDPLRKILPEFFKRIRNPPVNEKLERGLPQLIAQARYLESACGSARGIVEGAKADLVGTGIDVEPKCSSDFLRKALREDWLEWAEDATADGRSLWECQRTARAEWMLAGASLWVYRVLPERLDEGKLPLVIQEIEVEWLTPQPVETVPAGNTFVAGVEIDQLGRPVAYHVRSPDMDANAVDRGGERLEAAIVCHGFERRRPRQARGEPEFTPVIERLQQDDQLVTIELRAANNTAAPAFVAKVKNPQTSAAGEVLIAPGATAEIGLEESITAFNNERPSEKISPFRSTLRGDEAAGTGVSQQWIDRDAGRANFSSSRIDELLTQRLNAPKRNLFGAYVASDPYRRLVPLILVRRGIAMPKDQKALRDLYRHEIIPDEAEAVDRLKTAEAVEMELALGLTTRERECGRRGGDWRKNIAQQSLEKAECEKAGLPYLPPTPGAKPAAAPTEPSPKGAANG
jgi:lambda family phage portal protein